MGAAMPVAPEDCGAAANDHRAEPSPAVTAAPARSNEPGAVRAPYGCRLTIRSPPRAREWVSRRNVPFRLRPSEALQRELSIRLRATRRRNRAGTAVAPADGGAFRSDPSRRCVSVVLLGSGRPYFDPEGTVSILTGARDCGEEGCFRVAQDGRLSGTGAG